MYRTNLYRTVGVALAAAAVVSLTVPSGVSAGKGLRTVGKMLVYDADNRKVGKIFSLYDGDAVVSFKVEGNLVILHFDREDIWSLTSDRVFFTSADCSGQAYILNDYDWDIMPHGAVVGSVVYGRASSGGDPVTVSYNSELDEGGCGVSSDSTDYAWPAFLAIPDLSARFTPPFSIRAR
jgi:hypothetical protein